MESGEPLKLSRNTFHDCDLFLAQKIKVGVTAGTRAWIPAKLPVQFDATKASLSMRHLPVSVKRTASLLSEPRTIAINLPSGE